MSERLSSTEARALMAKTQAEQPETAIRKQIRDYLVVMGWDVTYHMAGPLSRKGFPDLTALKDGTTLYIEVKTAKGKLSDHQAKVKQAIESHGGTYIVARSVDDVMPWCRGE